MYYVLPCVTDGSISSWDRATPGWELGQNLTHQGESDGHLVLHSTGILVSKLWQKLWRLSYSFLTMQCGAVSTSSKFMTTPRLCIMFSNQSFYLNNKNKKKIVFSPTARNIDQDWTNPFSLFGFWDPLWIHNLGWTKGSVVTTKLEGEWIEKAIML